MSKNKETFDFNLPTLDDLFSTQEERDDAKLERVKILPVNELVPFKIIRLRYLMMKICINWSKV